MSKNFDDGKDRYGRPISNSLGTRIFRLLYGVRANEHADETIRQHDITATNLDDAEAQAKKFLDKNKRRFRVDLIQNRYVLIILLGALVCIIGYFYKHPLEIFSASKENEEEIQGMIIKPSNLIDNEKTI